MSADRIPACVVGLGLTEVGKVYGRSAADFAADAARRAVADAGLQMEDVDGLIVSGRRPDDVDLGLQFRLGLKDLTLLTQMQSFGTSAIQMLEYAAAAVERGQASAVVLVWADAPLVEKSDTGAAYQAQGRRQQSGWRAIARTGGAVAATNLYALAARRHMEAYGTTSEQLGAIAVAQRAWAAGNPAATMRAPITVADHQESRMVSDPLHLLDCCLVSNGGAALVVTSAERAADLRRRPINVLATAQSHPGYTRVRDERFGLVTGASRSGPRALARAGLELRDIDLVEVYDCYTYTALVTIEDYGFCAKGEGGEFLAEPGVLGPGGSLAVNTGGGQLSGFYLWGMTPLVEAVIQLRGDGGARQVDGARTALVSGNGGILDFHATAVLGVD